MIFFDKKKQKDIYIKKIEVLTQKINNDKKNPAIYFERANLYLKIQEPEFALNDCIEASRINKKYIKKSKYILGKYHPILNEKFLGALFYVIDVNQPKPFIKTKEDPK